jgi:hypothetical protein
LRSSLIVLLGFGLLVCSGCGTDRQEDAGRTAGESLQNAPAQQTGGEAEQPPQETGEDQTGDDDEFRLDVEIGNGRVKARAEGPGDESEVDVDVKPGGRVDVDVDMPKEQSKDNCDNR